MTRARPKSWCDHAKCWFDSAAKKTARATGHPVAFMTAVLLLAGWAALGPIFQFSDTWQLVINTLTTIVTFLMVFLIQNTQNRDSDAIQLKLDELIRVGKAHNILMDSEELSQDELTQIKERYERLANRARKELKNDRRQSRKTTAKSG